VTKTGMVKICDFGLADSVLWSHKQDWDPFKETGFTMFIQAPELVKWMDTRKERQETTVSVFTVADKLGITKLAKEKKEFIRKEAINANYSSILQQFEGLKGRNLNDTEKAKLQGAVAAEAAKVGRDYIFIRNEYQDQFRRKLETAEKNRIRDAIEAVNEAFETNLKKGKRGDVWAMGVTFYIFIYGEIPFKKIPRLIKNVYSPPLSEFLKTLMDDQVNFKKLHQEGNIDLPEELQKLILRLLTKLPAERPELKRILTATSIKGTGDEIDKKFDVLRQWKSFEGPERRAGKIGKAWLSKSQKNDPVPGTMGQRQDHNTIRDKQLSKSVVKTTDGTKESEEDCGGLDTEPVATTLGSARFDLDEAWFDLDDTEMPEMVHDYKMHNKLGKGGFGSVFKCERDGKVFAMKQVPRKRANPAEITTMKKTKHENILRLFHVYDEHKDWVYLVLEFAEEGATMGENFGIEDALPLNKAESYIRDTIIGMDYLHAQNIVHRDIKPCNLLVSDGRVKICDFGTSDTILWDVNQIREVWEPFADRGKTIAYLAPELVKRESWGDDRTASSSSESEDTPLSVFTVATQLGIKKAWWQPDDQEGLSQKMLSRPQIRTYAINANYLSILQQFEKVLDRNLDGKERTKLQNAVTAEASGVGRDYIFIKSEYQRQVLECPEKCPEKDTEKRNKTIKKIIKTLDIFREKQLCDGKRGDVWAMGVTFYVFLYGELPFEVPPKSQFGYLPGQYEEFYKSLTEMQLMFEPLHQEDNAKLPERLQKLILSLLTKAPEKRPSCKDIAQMENSELLLLWHEMSPEYNTWMPMKKRIQNCIGRKLTADETKMLQLANEKLRQNPVEPDRQWLNKDRRNFFGMGNIGHDKKVLALVPEICKEGDTAYFKKLQLSLVGCCLQLKLMKDRQAFGQLKQARRTFNDGIKGFKYKENDIQVFCFMQIVNYAALEGFQRHLDERSKFRTVWEDFLNPPPSIPPSPDLCIWNDSITYKSDTIKLEGEQGAFPLGYNLGKGAFAKVKVGFLITKGVKVAVKKMKNFLEETRSDIIQEIKTHYLVRHPHCVSLLGVVAVSKNEISVVQELCEGGDLASVMKERPNLLRTHFWKFAVQLAGALEYLHSQKIVHKDIKPQNVLLTGDDESCKLCDFGFGKKLETRQDLEVKKHLAEGTLEYMAPELFRTLDEREQFFKKDEIYKPDVYSLAILFLAMYSAGIDIFVGYPQSSPTLIRKLVVGEPFAGNPIVGSVVFVKSKKKTIPVMKKGH